METLFITLGASFYRWRGAIFVEDQTISGLSAWNANFDRVIACAICVEGEPPPGWSDPWAAGLDPARVELIGLPDGYRLSTFLRERRRVARVLGDAMRRADFRLLGLGGWIGDWSLVAARIARREGLAHAACFDRVESQVIAAAPRPGLRGHIAARIKSAITAFNERRVLAAADLALLNGRTVFDRFRQLTPNPQIIVDIHVDGADRIPPDLLAEKRATALRGPLRICYAGRVTAMKGPGLWLDTLDRLVTEEPAIEAVWLGDGDRLQRMRDRVARGPLQGKVRFEGFVCDRARVLDHLRRAHVLMFCHITDESPRVLVEALHSGTPIVGFSDPYAASLVAEQGGGRLVDRGDTLGLAAQIAALARNREELVRLIDRAAASARHLTRSRVFAHRSELVRTYLGQNKGRSPQWQT